MLSLVTGTAQGQSTLLTRIGPGFYPSTQRGKCHSKLMLNLIPFLLCDLLLELCLSGTRVTDLCLLLGSEPRRQAYHSSVHGPLFKGVGPAFCSTNQGVSFSASHKDQDFCPKTE